ncbi:diguanylate cyclase (GGDEF)-like protein [Tepidimonas ignava]|uniref:Diguanylate cyclase (GGDEF)-like protein n=1 Tax=Tepidimonas ignava TaxID=114249 RepID=A0A4R3LF11_9BURK|nr:EAL domain-containing protein [Tepidimonas ignava]TCS98653.1 diguanylate cyclase (GGDEF)-like protein [Tepidimonas ignava]
MWNSLRARLWLIIALAVVPLLALSYLDHQRQRQQAVAAIAAEVHAVRAAVLARERDVQTELRRVLTMMSRADEVSDAAPAACNGLAARLMLAYPTFNNLGAVRPDGTVFCSGRPAPPGTTLPVRVNDRAWFQATLQAYDMTAGELVVGRISGRRGLVYGYPVRDDQGTLQMALFAALQKEWFDDLVRASSLPPGWQAHVVDGEGHVLSSMPGTDAAALRQLFMQLRRADPARSVAEFHELAAPDGPPTLAGLIPLRLAMQPLYVVAHSNPERGLSVVERTFLWRLVGLVLLATTLVVFTRHQVYVLIERWIHRLRKALDAIGQGRFEPPFARPSPVRELGAVETAINQMADALRRHRDDLHHLTHHDPLTGLPNRVLLRDRLEHAIQSCVRHQRYAALLLVDIDRFKHINDTFGHDAGDAVLRQAAQRLRQAVREQDTVARLGDDAFAVVLEDLPATAPQAASTAERLAHKVQTAMLQPYAWDDQQPPYYATASIGLTLFDGDSVHADAVLRQAEVALFRVKEEGRNGIRFFSDELQAIVRTRVHTEQGLREALQRRQFVAFLQSQCDADGRVLGAEVLLRWQHDDGTYSPPGTFIDVAEETGLIVPMGEWVLRDTCERLRRWSHDPRLQALSLSVNVSPRQFRERDFVERVLTILDETGAPPDRLTLEITESVVLGDLHGTAQRLAPLRARGVHISLDDFGTGYASLAYLTALPLDELKIDQTFVREASTRERDRTVVRAIVELARTLGLRTVAEGVETDDQRRWLRELGCERLQGYALGRPTPASEWESMVPLV